MAARKHVHRTITTLTELGDMAATLESRTKPTPRVRTDNKPTPEQVAQIARAAVTDIDVNHAVDLHNACESSWSPEERALFWKLME